MKNTLFTLVGLLFVYGSPATSLVFAPIILHERPAAIDVLAMASVIEAEARGEDLKCRCMVGEVLKNRADWQGLTVNRSSRIGVKKRTPSKASIEIAREVLSTGHTHSLRFFYNPDLATDLKWVEKNRKKKKTKCGGHLFFE